MEEIKKALEVSNCLLQEIQTAPALVMLASQLLYPSIPKELATFTSMYFSTQKHNLCLLSLKLRVQAMMLISVQRRYFDRKGIKLDFLRPHHPPCSTSYQLPTKYIRFWDYKIRTKSLITLEHEITIELFLTSIPIQFSDECLFFLQNF